MKLAHSLWLGNFSQSITFQRNKNPEIIQHVKTNFYMFTNCSCVIWHNYAAIINVIATSHEGNVSFQMSDTPLQALPFAHSFCYFTELNMQILLEKNNCFTAICPMYQVHKRLLLLFLSLGS
jgi:uncharacterized protein with PQ loop repeat